ncbi:MAG: hydantoinase/oxoprolinase family protein, partial [Pseudomonadota bacterium]
MVRRAECRIAALTPSDAAHVLGWHDAWDVEAASAAADLFARQKDRRGMAIAADGRALAALIVETLTRRSAEALVTAAAAEDDYEMAEGLAQSTLAEAALAGRRGVLVPRLTLSVPVIGLGASASTYYPAVAERLGAEAAIPVHAGVANAVGAVVGQVRGQAETIVLPSDDGSFVLRIGEGQERYLDLESATAAGIAWITDAARTRALAAGASAVTVHHGQEDRTATVEGNDVLIERHLSATATGRPARAGEGG